MQKYPFDYNSELNAKNIVKSIGIKNTLSLLEHLERLLIEISQNKEKEPLDFASEEELELIRAENKVRDEIIRGRDAINLRLFESLPYMNKMKYIRSFVDNHNLSDVLNCIFDYNYGVDFDDYSSINSTEDVSDIRLQALENTRVTTDSIFDNNNASSFSQKIIDVCVDDKSKYFMALKLLKSLTDEENERKNWAEKQRTHDAYLNSVDWSAINRPYKDICPVCDADYNEPCRLSDEQACSR